jgi:hypothetical protein
MCRRTIVNVFFGMNFAKLQKPGKIRKFSNCPFKQETEPGAGQDWDYSSDGLCHPWDSLLLY